MKFKIFFIFALSFCVQAHAHRFHAAITDISVNQKTNNIEIIHTLMTHDVEAVLHQIHQRPLDLTKGEDEQLLKRYVEQYFYLENREKKHLKLQWIGVKIEADHISIYQELEKTPLSKISLIHQNILTDLLPNQINTVNVSTPKGLRTYIFNNKIKEQSLMVK